MLEILQNFESAAYGWDPLFLVGPGIIGVLAGLLMWIAGLKLSRVVAVILGSIAGAVIALKLTDKNHLAAAFLGAAVAAVLSLVCEKIVIVILGALIIAALLLAVFAGNYLDKLTPADLPSASRQPLTPAQTLESIARQAAIIQARMGQLFGSIPKLSFPLAAIVAGVIIFLGVMFVRLIVAVSCSSVGTCLIFAGMTSLLLYKGSDPLTHIYQRFSFYVLVFSIMVVFGTIVQLLLCQPRTEPPGIDALEPGPARQPRGE